MVVILLYYTFFYTACKKLSLIYLRNGIMCCKTSKWKEIYWKSEIQNWFGTLEKQINELTVFLTTVSVTVS